MEDSSLPGGGLLSEPRGIMQALMGKFQATNDVAAIRRINENYEKIQIARAQRLAASRDALHQWMKKVEGAKWEAQRPADRSEIAQEERMAALERDRISLAKAVNELEMALQREEMLQLQLQERAEVIRRRLNQLEQQDGQLGEHRIRATVYRDLGLSWIWSTESESPPHPWEKLSVDNNGVLTGWQNLTFKCRVVNRQKNDVFTLNLLPISESKSTCFDEAKLLWQALGM